LVDVRAGGAAGGIGDQQELAVGLGFHIPEDVVPTEVDDVFIRRGVGMLGGTGAAGGEGASDTGGWDGGEALGDREVGDDGTAARGPGDRTEFAVDAVLEADAIGAIGGRGWGGGDRAEADEAEGVDVDARGKVDVGLEEEIAGVLIEEGELGGELGEAVGGGARGEGGLANGVAGDSATGARGGGLPAVDGVQGPGGEVIDEELLGLVGPVLDPAAIGGGDRANGDTLGAVGEGAGLGVDRGGALDGEGLGERRRG